MNINWQSRPATMNKDNAKRILFEVKDILDKHNIEFCLLFSTCLGAIREKGWIDEDFDIDLGIKHNILLPKLDILKDEFEKLGYDTHYLSTPYSYNRMLKVQKDEIRVDIANLDKHNGYYFHPIGPEGDCEVFPVEMFDNLKEIEFMGAKFKVPNPPEEFLKLCYGDNWAIKDVNYNYKATATCLRIKYWQQEGLDIEESEAIQEAEKAQAESEAEEQGRAEYEEEQARQAEGDMEQEYFEGHPEED